MPNANLGVDVIQPAPDTYSPEYFNNIAGKLNRMFRRLSNGSQGQSILSGTGAPALALGNVGDIYIDTKNNILYPPKTSSGWGTGIALG